MYKPLNCLLITTLISNIPGLGTQKKKMQILFLASYLFFQNVNCWSILDCSFFFFPLFMFSVLQYNYSGCFFNPPFFLVWILQSLENTFFPLLEKIPLDSQYHITWNLLLGPKDKTPTLCHHLQSILLLLLSSKILTITSKKNLGTLLAFKLFALLVQWTSTVLKIRKLWFGSCFFPIISLMAL